MRFSILLLTLSLVNIWIFAEKANADSSQSVYRCKNSNGGTSFSDKACSSKNTKKMDYVQIQALPMTHSIKPKIINHNYDNGDQYSSKQPCPNVFEVNERYNKAIQDVRFHNMRNDQQDYQKQEIERLEYSRRAELHGC